MKITDGVGEFDFLEKVDNSIRLKRTNKYYFQVIGQLKLAKKSHAYFIVYTLDDIFYEKIPHDEDFFMNEMLPKLEKFYYDKYCPYIAAQL